MLKNFDEFSKPLNEAYFPPHGADAPDVKNAKKTLANLFNNLKSIYKVKDSTLDLLSDAIDDYADAYAEERIDNL